MVTYRSSVSLAIRDVGDDGVVQWNYLQSLIAYPWKSPRLERAAKQSGSGRFFGLAACGAEHLGQGSDAEEVLRAEPIRSMRSRL